MHGEALACDACVSKDARRCCLFRCCARVAVACDDGVARLFTAEPGQPGLGYAKSLPSLGSRVLSVAWHPSGQSLLLGTAAGTLHAWALASGRELLRINVGALLLLLLMAFPGGTSSTSAKS